MLVNDKIFIGKLLSFGSLATLLIVTPSSSVDPINVPKFAVLVITASIALSLLVKNYKVIMTSQNRLVLIAGGIFTFSLGVAFLLSDIDPWTQFFGVNGRNTGLVNYLSLIILFLAASFLTTSGFEGIYAKALLSGGFLSAIYGLIQAFDLDPANWVNPYSPVIGFLGNPNFQSSFLGISCVVAFALALKEGSRRELRFFYFLFIGFSLFVISKSDAQQGYLVFLAGIVVVVGILIWHSKQKKYFALYAVLSFFGFAVTTFGTLNKGFLAPFLYKESVTYRGDYWRAGWKVTLENPIFGVGLDGYGDWYRRARSIEATLRRGPEVTSNAAHNVFLDLSSNGGFILLGAYFSVLLLVVVAIIKVLKADKKFDSNFVALVGAWVGYNAQSIISLNQIGLAIWGWILSGAIIGYSLRLNEKVQRGPSKSHKRKSAADMARRKISPTSSVAVFLGILIGIAAGMPPYLASAKYKTALETGDPVTIQQAAYIWPLESTRMIQVAMTLNDNKLEDQGLKVALDAVERFPDNYGVWSTLNSMNKATEAQKAQALAQMKRLDPLNPNLK